MTGFFVCAHRVPLWRAAGHFGGERGPMAWLTHVCEYSILISMSKRLQVLLEEAEFAEIRRAARLNRLTVAAWVRQVLRKARREEPSAEPRRKLAAVHEAMRSSFPTADIEQMTDEIERGYLSDTA